jgi:hypothetical protein
VLAVDAGTDPQSIEDRLHDAGSAVGYAGQWRQRGLGAQGLG